MRMDVIATLLGYLSPLLALFLGAGLGNALIGSHAAAALGAMAGFMAALVLARLALTLEPPPPRSRLSR